MEVLSLCSPPCASRLRSSPWRRAFLEKSTGRPLLLPRRPWTSIGDGNLRSLDFRPRNSSGPTKVAASSNVNAEVSKRETSSKDKDLAFVAGATGRVGSRLVRELLKLGFRARAGVRSIQRAEALVESVRQMKLHDGTGTSGTEPTEKLEIVECDLEKQGGIVPAIGNASVVLCCIGASEKEIADVTGPYRIDYKATENLIKAATDAKVDHFILLTSLGTNKIGFPAAILNLFWGVLIWKRKAEEALIASGLPYTIVRPGGMERPTDSFKETHNLVLANEDTRFGGLVSNLQVAELMACMAKNKKLSYCKVVEVIAETTAPLLPMEELLVKIPSKREPPAGIVQDLAPSSTESKPTTPAVEEKPEKTQVQKTRPLSPYYMYDNLKPPSSPTPMPSATPGSSNEKKVDLVQAETASAPKSTASSSKLSRPLSPYTAYENLKPPSSPSPTPSIASTGTTESAANVVPVSQNGPATENTVFPDVPGSHEVTNSNSSYRSPFPLWPPVALALYEDLKPPASPTPSSPKY